MSYESWQDLVDEDELAESVATGMDGGGDGMSGISDALNKASLAPELEALARQVPELNDLFNQRDQLRAQMAALTGNKGQETENPRFPLLDGPRKPLGGADSKRKAADSLPHETLPSADDNRDARRDRSRSTELLGDLFENDVTLPRDEKRDANRHRSAFERTEQRMTQAAKASTTGAAMSRAAVMRRQFKNDTERLANRRDKLQAKQTQRPGNAGRQKQVDRLNQQVTRRRSVGRGLQEKRDKMREKDAARQRAHKRMGERQMRLQDGPSWLPKPGLREMSGSIEEDVGRNIKRLLLKALPSTWKDRDGKLSMAKMLERDEERAEKRRKKTQERRQKRREEERREAEQRDRKRDERKQKRMKKRKRK